MSTRPRASIVIPVWNEVTVTLRCLESIVAHTTDGTYHVVIVDNASTDATPELLAGLDGDVTVITNEENLGYTLASNQGAAATDHEVVVFLNNDTEPQPWWLDGLLDCLDEHPETAIVGSRLVYPNGLLQEAGGLVFADGTGWNFGRLARPEDLRFGSGYEVDYCSGASLAVRRSFLDQVGGGYDPRYAPAYYEDTDLCFAARRHGWTVRYEPRSTVVHHEGITAGTDVTSGYKAYQERNRGVFVRKWAAELARQEPSPARTGREPRVADRTKRPCGVPRRATPTARRPGPPRVLVVDPFMPIHDRASGSLRLRRILESMVDAGNEVTFVGRNGCNQDRYADELRALGITVHRSDRHRLRQLGADDETAPFLEFDRVLVDGDFDIAWLDFADLAHAYLPLVRHWSPRTQVWVDSVDVHHVRERRRAELALGAGDADAADLLVAAERTRVFEQWVYGLADGVIAVTADDRDEILALVPGADVEIVPNIHPLADVVAPLEHRSGCLFVGSFGHPPNGDAVRWLCTGIVPEMRRSIAAAPEERHAPTVRVIGSGASDALETLMASTPGVDHLGWVPEMAPHLDAARVSIAPLRYGAGMKGKVAEAMAAGLPVVTTTVGAEGMGLVDGRHVLVADDDRSFAAAVVRLSTDDELWYRLSAAGRALIRDRYSPAVVGRAVEAVVDRAVGAAADRRRDPVYSA